jgi:hypothetical protein
MGRENVYNNELLPACRLTIFATCHLAQTDRGITAE